MEGELRWAAARLISDFGLTGDLTEQVIEGTPEKEFAGRLSIVVKAHLCDESWKVATEVTA